MATTITANDGTGDVLEPLAVEGFTADRESQNVIHGLIGGGIAVTLVKPRPRANTWALVFSVEADAVEALELLSRETTFTLANTDRPFMDTDFVLDGTLSVQLDATGAFWRVDVGYQEVEL
jgi:hypothetical protein